MLWFFALTLFVSAYLLFLVQPMVGNMVLPLLGGTPAVWNTCMVFFQGVLLVGYAYTHHLSTWPNRRRQIVVHGVLLVLPFLVLPFSLGNWQPPTEDNPIFSVLRLLLGMVGLPFFVVATSAPLLQKWFAATGHPASRDPYFLYGASNLGSMLALLLYPILVQPMLELGTQAENVSFFNQATAWTMGYGLFVVLVLGCGLAAWKGQATWEISPPLDSAPAPVKPAETPASTAIQPARKTRARDRLRPALEAEAKKNAAPELNPNRRITALRRLRWVALAAAPSSLMLGVTTYFTTDIAAIPLFWVVPLALYLLTFILVFARWPTTWTDQPHNAVLYIQPFFVMTLVLIQVANLSPDNWMKFLIHLAAFFSTALMCHGELARDRPPISHLTEFYLWMSVGGVLGGMVNALVAPTFFIFKYGPIVEYSLALVAACLLRPSLVTNETFIPGDSQEGKRTGLGLGLDWLMPLGILLLTMGCLLDRFSFMRHFLMFGLVFLVLMLMMRPLRFGLSLGFLILIVTVTDRGPNLIFEDRGFFGLLRVYERSWEGHHGEKKVIHELIHGGISHGSQFMEPKSWRRRPITYFYKDNGVGQVFESFSWPDARLPASLVGLGALPGGLVTSVYADLEDKEGPGVLATSEPPYAVVGLGVGTLAGHARLWQHVTFFEIDPLVIGLSLPRDRTKPMFYYLQDAVDRDAHLKVYPGDGRLTLKHMPDKYYRTLVLDAFSSDAIPVHLLTLEAMNLYLKKLADGGIMMFNTTNRYVDIQPVLADLARELDLTCVSRAHAADEKDLVASEHLVSGTDWLAMQRRLPIGQAVVKEIVRSDGDTVLVRCLVTQGTFQRGAKIRVLRDKEPLKPLLPGLADLDFLQISEKDVDRADQGSECRLLIQGYGKVKTDEGVGIKVGDIIEGVSLANGSPPLDWILDMHGWKMVKPLGGPVWRDSYSNLLRVFHWW